MSLLSTGSGRRSWLISLPASKVSRQDGREAFVCAQEYDMPEIIIHNWIAIGDTQHRRVPRARLVIGFTLLFARLPDVDMFECLGIRHVNHLAMALIQFFHPFQALFSFRELATMCNASR
jgi:hypothetical protein